MMNKDEIKIDKRKLDRMMIGILRLEQRNNRTKTKNFKDMVYEIKKIITDELKENE